MATIEHTGTEDKLIDVLHFIARERNISFEMLLEALEAALLTAYKRHFGSESNAIVIVDRQSGAYRVFHRRNVVDEVDRSEARDLGEGGRRPYQVGDFFDEEVTPKDFGRIAAQTAKQVIVQRIREAERDTVYNKYVRKLNDLVTGTVQRYEQRNMYVTLEGRDEAVMYLDEQVPGEAYRINDFIRAYVLDVKKSPKGPQVILSRAAEGLVQRLLELEVPEIADGTVEIMAIARDPGGRSKVAVKSNRRRSRSDRRVLGSEVEPHRQRHRQSARREGRHHPLRCDAGDLHYERAGARESDRRRAFRGRRRRARYRSRLPALACDRARRPERSARRAAHRLAAGYRQRKRVGAARERYLVERAERATSRQRSEMSVEAGAAPVDGEEIDAELIRKLEEFRRERLGTTKPRARSAPASVAGSASRRWSSSDSCARPPAGVPTHGAPAGRLAAAPISARSRARERAAKNKRYPGLGAAAVEYGLIESSWQR